MAAGIIQLPSGTEVKQTVNLPVSGGWCGIVCTRITCMVDATIHEWLYYNPRESDTKLRIRRVGTSQATNFYNSPLKAGQELGWWMVNNESSIRLTYTSTKPISLSFETTKAQGVFTWTSVTTAQWNKQADVKPWETNLTYGNVTERGVLRPWLDGVMYWVPK